MAVVYPGLESYIAHMPDVRLAVAEQAEEIGARASALFEPHNRPGRHEIEVERGKVDSLVSLTGPAPLSVEFGRGPDEHGKGRMRGLHILGRAAGL